MQKQHDRRQFLKTAGATAVTGAAGAVAMPSIGKAAAPFFKLYLMIPNNQPARMVWGTFAAQQITKLGIDVVSSFVPFTVIIPRRTKGEGKTHVDGGWDAYLERYYYSSITPVPNNLFRSTALPPSGENYYYVNDPQIDKALDDYGAARDDKTRMEAIHRFEKRWLDTEPMTILFYPQDVIAVNPKLKGYSATTFNPVFFPDPENWTIEGAGSDATAAFASWAPPSNLIPMYTAGYNESNIFGPVYNRLYEYDGWEKKQLVPALAESCTPSEDGKHWDVKLREGVKWHSGEDFTANDVKFTWDAILNKAYTSPFQAAFQRIFGSTNAYKVVGKHQLAVDLPAYTIEFLAWILGAIQIMPEHAYKDIKPETLRGHVANTWLGTYTAKTSDGKSFTAHGGIGTGPWVAAGYDPSRKAYKYTKNESYWKKTPGNVKTFYVVNINGTDSVLSALKAGEIDAHDPMYDIGSLVSTIDPSWGKVQAYDSYKWQHVCYNLRHPVFGTGVETPLGKQDPSRAAEAAAYIRKAFSYAMPREQIVKEIAAGYGVPGTVAMPYTAPEYDHELLKPIAYDLDLAKQYMEKAGYKY
jgi:ABC-type transport system substrate-binding protein